MKTYDVTLPVVGYVTVTVKAGNEKDAIKAGINAEWDITDIYDLEAYVHIVQGNVCYVSKSSARAVEAEDEDEYDDEYDESEAA